MRTNARWELPDARRRARLGRPERGLLLALALACCWPAGARAFRPPAAAPARQLVVTYPADLDVDGNRILDRLDQELAASPDAGVQQVAVILFDEPLSEDIAAFEDLGGRVISVWRHATYGWWGELPRARIATLPALYGERLCIIQSADEVDGQPDMDLATRIVRARDQTWITYGYTGDADGSIAILDSGIAGTHDDLADPDGDNWFNDPDDWNDACADGWDAAYRVQGWWWYTGSHANPVDQTGHGTAVAGCAAGDGSVNALLKGVAPASHLVGIRISNTSSTQAIDAMNRAVANKQCARIKVVNLSSSYQPANPQWIMDVATNVVQNGIVMTCSAGNEFPNDPTRYPGRNEKVITVGASTDQDQVAGYSSNGPVGIAKPDVVAPGGGALPAGGSINTTHISPPDSYDTVAGTSFAAPIVAGAASLLIDAWEQADGFSWGWTEWEARAIKNVLLMTASETDSTGENGNNPGAKDRGGHDRTEGYGRINLDAAVEALTMDLEAGVVAADSFGAGVTDKKVWAREIGVIGPCVQAVLEVPPTGDYDLYLYSSVPDANGIPVIRGSSTAATMGNTEVVNLDIGYVGDGMFLVVKWVAGSGQFNVYYRDSSLEWEDATTGPLAGTAVGFGHAWGDFDNDDDPDLYLSQGSQPNLLLRNDGGGAFTDVTVAPLDHGGDARAPIWGDVDNDGDVDLYVCNFGTNGLPNKLFRNDTIGNGVSFADITSTVLAGAEKTLSAVWADYDLDGDVDLYVVNFEQPDKLLRNDGPDGGGGVTFTDVTTLLGSGDSGRSNQAVWGDVDNDGDPDLYLAKSGGQANRLYRNDGASGFTDIANSPENDAGNGTGVAFGDYDNDGDLDLYVSNFDASTNRLLRNDGDDGVGGIAFTDVTAGPLGPIDFTYGVAWGDYDLDGFLDLYVVSLYADENRLLRNTGSGSFVDVTPDVLRGEFWMQSATTAFADADGDGDLDLYVGNLNAPNTYFENTVCNDRHWFEIRLVTTQANAIGARIEVTAGGVTQIREIAAGSGMASQGPLTQHFGLGDASQVDTVEIRWPTGEVQTLGPFAADTRVPVTEPEPILLGQVIQNHDFATGDLPPWEFTAGYNAGHPEPQYVIETVAGMPTALHITRAPDSDGSHAVVVQELGRNGVGISLGEIGDAVGLDFAVLINSHNFTNYAAWNVYPANVWVEYEDGQGVAHTFRRSFYLTDPSGAADAQSEELTAGVWATRSYDLRNLDPPIHRIMEVRAGCEGWSYDAAFDNLVLMVQRTGVDDEPYLAPVLTSRLLGNHPNPFNPSTTITFDLHEQSPVRLLIYDVRGGVVRNLTGGVLSAGEHRVIWDGRSDNGQRVSSGVYFVRLEAGAFTGHHKMVLAK